MATQPTIIEVLARDDHQRIRRAMIHLGVLGIILLSTTLVIVKRYSNDHHELLITGGIFLLLFCNGVLFFRNSLMNRCLRSLCFDQGRCYLSSDELNTPTSGASKLYFKKESLIIHGEHTDTAEMMASYQVLSNHDWQAINNLRHLQ